LGVDLALKNSAGKHLRASDGCDDAAALIGGIIVDDVALHASVER
jgi:hypothetical protein